MTPKELFSFDLNGYLVVEDFLSAGLLDALNASIDHFAEGYTRRAQVALNGTCVRMCCIYSMAHRRKV